MDKRQRQIKSELTLFPEVKETRKEEQKEEHTNDFCDVSD
jgi:hypothetical protein